MADSRSGAGNIQVVPESKELLKNNQRNKQANKNSYNNGRYVKITVCQKDKGAPQKELPMAKASKTVQIKKVILDYNPKYIINIPESILRY